MRKSQIENTGKVAQKVKWHNKMFNFKCAKRNILIYIRDGGHYFDDWEEDAYILIIEFKPYNSPKNAYYVLHQIRAKEYYPDVEDIHTYKERCAEPIF